ncbi:hypothetical protein D3C71_1413040 [compost metagenome]
MRLICAFLGKGLGKHRVPRLDDGPLDLLGDPDRLRLAVIDLGDRTVAERIIVGCVDNDDVLGNGLKQRGEIAMRCERDGEDHRIHTCYGIFPGRCRRTDFCGKVADRFRSPGIGKLDLVPSRRELACQCRTDVACANDSDLHCHSLAESIELNALRRRRDFSYSED